MESSTNKRYSGRFFSPQEIEQVRELIRTSAQMNRQQLSYRVCERFDWRKTDGSLKDMSCRVALLRMHREGLIELPAPRHKVNPCRSFARRTVQAQPGAQLRYFAYTGDRLLGLLGFGAAAWKTGPRDAWIGWSRAQRQRNLGDVVNNARFLILPWVRVQCLASKLLSLISRELPGAWEARYGYRPVLLETFVEAARFAGTCYKAANWQCLGQTQGRGKLGDHRLGQVPVKDVWVYPLVKDFRERLCR